MVIAFYQTM